MTHSSRLGKSGSRAGEPSQAPSIPTPRPRPASPARTHRPERSDSAPRVLQPAQGAHWPASRPEPPHSHKPRGGPAGLARARAGLGPRRASAPSLQLAVRILRQRGTPLVGHRAVSLVSPVSLVPLVSSNSLRKPEANRSWRPATPPKPLVADYRRPVQQESSRSANTRSRCKRPPHSCSVAFNKARPTSYLAHEASPTELGRPRPEQPEPLGALGFNSSYCAPHEPPSERQTRQLASQPAR